MMIQPEIIETVLQENGINRPQAKMIVEQLKMVMSERSANIQSYIDALYIKAIEMNIKPSQDGTISEQQAVKMLGKSKAFFRVARLQKRLTPDCEPYLVCLRVNILSDYPDDKIQIYP